MVKDVFPSNAELSVLVVAALEALGGRGSNEQIREEVARALHLTSEDLLKIHSGKRTVLEYRLAWARTIAKQKNQIKPLGRMNWELVSTKGPTG